MLKEEIKGLNKYIADAHKEIEEEKQRVEADVEEAALYFFSEHPCSPYGFVEEFYNALTHIYYDQIGVFRKEQALENISLRVSVLQQYLERCSQDYPAVQ